MKTRGKKQPVVKPLHIVSITLSATEQEQLNSLAEALTDALGRGVSRSATLRALVRFASKQGEHWLYAHVVPEIEQELPAHQWGRKAG